jgi:hypothetical protein
MTLTNEPLEGPYQPVETDHLFVSTRPLLVLDHFRTPYVVSGETGCAGLCTLRAGTDGPELLWPSSFACDGDLVQAELRREPDQRIPLFARIVGDEEAQATLSEYGGRWTRFATVVQPDGGTLGSLWRHEDGSVFLPFDPDEAQLSLLSECYHAAMSGSVKRDFRRTAVRGYYRARSFMPRPVWIWLRRRYARVQARTTFPRWPIEPALDDLLDLLHSILQSIAGEPVPSIAPWPDGKRWALVCTHDVETQRGVAALDPVLAVERSLGVRSCWNFAPRRYEVTLDQVEGLIESGCEVGVHGLYHDGRDLDPDMLSERLPGMRRAADDWQATGFRAPATRRDWATMPLLGFDYDSSYPDTDPFEPQAGGCCAWLPFFNQSTVELPITMPQDHTLFVILRHRDEQTWVRKAQLLRARGGMALLDTHPDYLTDPTIFGSYRRFLERFAPDPDVWLALPDEVNTWWRRRADSRLVRTADSWTIAGPASGEASIAFRSYDPELPAVVS